MKDIQVLHGKSWKKIYRCLKLIILFLLISVPCAFAESNDINEAKQERLITGTVTDDIGEALIGVSVSIKGTTTGTLTDLDGKYSLSVPNGSAVLVFTYVGYDTQEFIVGNQSNISVVLKNKDAFLDEVVIVGYGVQKKKLITGVTVQVGGDDLTKLSTVNALGALQSQAPGVNITQSSGMPGEGYKVNIRGTADASMVFSIQGASLTKKRSDGTTVKGTFSFDMTKTTNDTSGNTWAIGKLKTAGVTVLVGVSPDEGKASVYEYDIHTLDEETLILSYAPAGSGEWGNCYYWKFVPKK